MTAPPPGSVAIAGLIAVVWGLVIVFYATTLPSLLKILEELW